MYKKKLQLGMYGQEELAISKDERYELIAQIAQGLNEFRESRNVEDNELWDSNDTELNFVDIVSNYN